MNLVHTKTRNRLAVEKVDKLMYISINTRSLDLVDSAEELYGVEDEEQVLLLEEAEIERQLQLQMHGLTSKKRRLD